MEAEVRGADRREKWRSKRLISIINEIQLKTVIIKNKKSKTIFSFFKESKTIFIYFKTQETQINICEEYILRVFTFTLAASFMSAISVLMVL